MYKICQFLLSFLFISCVQNSPHSPHAIWTESIYLRGYQPTTKELLTEKNIRDFAGRMEQYGITYVYLFAGPYGEDGHLPKYPFTESAKNSIATMRDENPNLVVLPWVGGIQNKTVYLGDTAWVKNALSDTKKLIEHLNVPGVHIDFEYILKGDPYLDTEIHPERAGDEDAYPTNVNAFHKKLRELLPHTFVSSVVTATCPETTAWKRKTTLSELDTLLRYVDQMSFLFYDTSIKEQSLFEQAAHSLVKDLAVLKEKHPQVQLLTSIGTFVNRPELHKYRDQQIETITNTLTVLDKAMQNQNTLPVEGISIFCDWQTNEAEYEEFKEVAQTMTFYEDSKEAQQP